MKEMITLCGDNCTWCSRYNARSEAELRKVAELWHRVGWRDTVVSNDEIGVKRLKDVFHFRAEVPVILADKSSHNFQVESLKEVGIPI